MGISPYCGGEKERGKCFRELWKNLIYKKEILSEYFAVGV